MKKYFNIRFGLCLLALMFVLPAAQAEYMSSQEEENGQQEITLSGSLSYGTRVINVTASQYKFSPDPIIVKRGERVRIIATTADVKHGFAIRDLNVNAIINPGKTKKIDFVAYKAGEFQIHCSVYCGEGHKGMVGKLIVIK